MNNHSPITSRDSKWPGSPNQIRANMFSNTGINSGSQLFRSCLATISLRQKFALLRSNFEYSVRQEFVLFRTHLLIITTQHYSVSRAPSQGLCAKDLLYSGRSKSDPQF